MKLEINVFARGIKENCDIFVLFCCVLLCSLHYMSFHCGTLILFVYILWYQFAPQMVKRLLKYELALQTNHQRCNKIFQSLTGKFVNVQRSTRRSSFVKKAARANTIQATRRNTSREILRWTFSKILLRESWKGNCTLKIQPFISTTHLNSSCCQECSNQKNVRIRESVSIGKSSF